MFYRLVSKINGHVESNLWVVMLLSEIKTARHYYMRVITFDISLPNAL